MNGFLLAAFLLLWIVVIVLGVLVLGLMNRLSGYLETAAKRLEDGAPPADLGGASAGTRVPPFVVTDADGHDVSSDQLLAPKSVVIFADPDCSPCELMFNSFERVGSARSSLPLLIITQHGTSDSVFPYPPGVPLFYQDNRRASRAFDNIAAPQAFAVRDGVVVAKGIPRKVSDLSKLAEALEGDEAADHQGRALDPRLER